MVDPASEPEQTRNMRRRRIISVALPWLTAEHRLRAEGRSGLEHPFAVVERAAGTLRLAGVNRAAADAGLDAGMGLSDARSVCPTLLTRPAAPERLAGFVAALARWAERFAPLVGQDQGPSLVLDASGVAHLFGGEQAMLGALVAELAGRGLTARAAIADTKGAAWALAHHGPGNGGARTLVAPPGHTRQAIGPLPVAALRLDPETAQALAAVGLATIEPLTRMPRGALARRFGIEAMRRLDQALGAESEPVAPERRLPAFSVRLTLPEPIGLVASVAAALDTLLERLCGQLETHQMGARRLRLTARRVDRADQGAEIRLARPGRDPMRLRELFQPKLAGIDAGFGIDALRLAAPEVEPLKPAQLGQRHRETEATRLADLVSRLGNRIGFENVLRFLPAESHAPERAQTIAAAAYSEPEVWSWTGPARPIVLFAPEPVRCLEDDPPALGLPSSPSVPPSLTLPHKGGGDRARPVLLVSHEGGGNRTRPAGAESRGADLPRPAGAEARAREEGAALLHGAAGPLPPCGGGSGRGESGARGERRACLPPPAFAWRGQRLTTLCAQGPERLAPEWWLDDPAWASGTRDYWRVETVEGPRLWLFHTPADPGADPDSASGPRARPAWHAHGIFA
jgi:protein ImuB